MRQPPYMCSVFLKKWMVVSVEGVHGMGADEIEVVMGTCGLEGVGCQCGLGT